MLEQKKWLDQLGLTLSLLTQTSNREDGLLSRVTTLGNIFDQLGSTIKSVKSDLIQSPLETFNNNKKQYHLNQLGSGIEKIVTQTQSNFMKAFSNIKLNITQPNLTELMINNPVTESYNVLLNQLNQIKSNAFLSLFSKVMPYLSSVLEAVNTWVINHSQMIDSWIGNLIDQLPEAENLINTVGYAITSLVGIVNQFVSVIGGWNTVIAAFIGFKIASSVSAIVATFHSLGAVIPIVTSAFNALVVAFQASPIGMTITAIAFGAMLIMQYWQPLLGFFNQLLSKIKLVFIETINWIKPMFLWIANAISYAYKGIELVSGFFGWNTQSSTSDLNSVNVDVKKIQTNKTEDITALTKVRKVKDDNLFPVDEIIQSNYKHYAQTSNFNHHLKSADNSKTTKKIEVKNYITLDANSNNSRDFIESAAYLGTEKALALFDIDGGY
ncbi:hypothetical protein L3V82_03505 [Thiotrichales bacterium 19S3-7]|nr:hypothetical protein [Thiotrichales bacterium 19S3-7]MCF6801287.1 hypothetical protein [Thiotrichales bacterium 19S3-11]